MKEGYVASFSFSITGRTISFLDETTMQPESEPYSLSLMDDNMDKNLIKAGAKGIKVSVEWEWQAKRGMKEIRSYELLFHERRHKR